MRTNKINEKEIIKALQWITCFQFSVSKGSQVPLTSLKSLSLLPVLQNALLLDLIFHSKENKKNQRSGKTTASFFYLIIILLSFKVGALLSLPFFLLKCMTSSGFILPISIWHFRVDFSWDVFCHLLDVRCFYKRPHLFITASQSLFFYHFCAQIKMKPRHCTISSEI